MDIERSADELDIASELEMAFSEKAQEAIVLRLRPEKHPDFNGKDCIICEEPLPELRIAMGRIRCVACQQRKEAKEKLYCGL